MKNAVILLAAAAASMVAAVPHVGGHNHHHQHFHQHHKRDDVAVAPGPTIIAYVLDGQPISAQEVAQGIANGTLIWAHGSLSQQPASAAAPTPSPSTPPPAPSPPPAPTEAASSGGWSDSGNGVDTPFPDGVSCSNFPSDYGAVAVDWLNLGGWTGIQSPGSSSGGFGNIETATSGGCKEGSYCSYACPPGYQKSQWPETQGATGQSVGGLLCQGGTLQLTNPGLSNKLCIPGASQVTVQVKNTLGDQVAVCRTDYPGTESETIPLDSQPGSTLPLTCPDASSYYMWEGSHTSAQYYVNPKGVSVQDGCQWGSSGNPWGNFAPLNLGVGYSNGAAWLSIFQNAPTTDASLDFTVEIVGDSVSGTCKYQNGQYCGGANYDDCSSTTGCTVSLSSGTATFVFS